MNKFLGWLALMLGCSSTAFAVEDGQVSKSLMSIFQGMNSIFSGVCIIVGIGLLFSAFIQYRQHRTNKLLVPISKPIFIFILGAVLIAIPILGHFTQGGQLASQQGY